MTWKTELNDHVDIANLRVNTIADNVFRPDPVRPRTTYVTDPTLALIRLRRAANRATRAYHADATSSRATEAKVKLAYQLYEATIPTITAVEALKDISTLTTMVDTAIRMVHYLTPVEEMQLAARAFLHRAEPQLTHAIRADKTAMLDTHADKLTDSLKANASRQEWMEAKTLLRFGGRPPRCATEHPYLEDDDGTPIQDRGQQAEAELMYFAKAEHSTFKTPQDICDNYNQHALEATTLRALQDTPLEKLMTEYECEDLFHQSKMGRSGGPDGITDDLTKIAPKEMTRIYYPIVVKEQMATVEPISHKGGWQTSFAKPNTQKVDMSGRRMILLNNIVAKNHHKFLQSRLKAVIAQLLCDAQSGARPNQSTDFVTHTTLTAIKHMKNKGQPLLLLFLGLKDAFYRVVLQFVYRRPTTPDELLDLMNTIQFPDAFLPALQAAMNGAPLIDKAVDDEHLCALVKDAHTDLWATTRGATCIAQPRTSTRPGVPMSDLTFNYLFVELTKHITEDMISAKIDLTIQTDDEQPCLAQARTFTDLQDGGKRLTDTSFVDDLTVYAVPRARAPAAVKGTAKRTLEIVVKWTYAYGMRPHATRTKLMMALNGDKPRITTEELARENYTSVRHPLLDEPVELVEHQVTLGTMVTPTTQGPEIRRRSSKAIANRGPLRKEISPRPWIPQYKKVLYNDTLTNSRLLFNCHVWNTMTDGESTMLEAEYIKGYRLHRPQNEKPRRTTRTQP